MSTVIEPGATISHYRITALLGAGGMGQVFRATDSRLSRDVAIKILPATTDLSLHQRFTQEARAASALNHPNIVGVYDVGTQDGIPFIVSELVDGESLRGLIQRGPVPRRKLLDLATQIADGIAAAHAAGIVHRDLKPENIMIARDGRAKILDFGLAKTENRNPALNAEDATLAMTQTQPGLILGTVNYMSPEQARGVASDYRSDQFSFGAILYEMVTGNQPFRRETTVQTLSAVLADDPPPIPGDAKMPVPLRWIMDRCLAKEPAQRYGSTIDLYHDLRNLRDHATEMTGLGAAAVAAQAPKRRNMKRVIAIVLPVLTLALGYALSRIMAPDISDVSGYKFTPIATEATYESEPMWSPDSRSMVYAADVKGTNQLFVRSLDSPTPVQITRGTLGCRSPFWHPKEPRIFFLASSDLYSVAIAGGDPERVLQRVSAAAISPDGSALAVLRRDPNKVQSGFVEISSPPGSTPRRYLPAPFTGGFYYGGAQLRFAPDGSKIFFFIEYPKGPPESWLLPWPNEGGRESPARIFTTLPGRVESFSWLPDSKRAIIALSSGDEPGHLWLADTHRGLVRAITTGIGNEVHADISGDGAKVGYAELEEEYDIVDLPFNDDPIRPVIATSRREFSAVWSPASPQFAYVTNRGGSYEIWLKSRQEGWERPIVRRADFKDQVSGSLTGLAFSPDGGRIAYVRSSIGKYNIWISPVSGGSAVRLTEEDATGQFAPTWSPDGNWIAFLQINGTSLKLVKSRVGSREAPTPIDSQLGPLDLSNPRWSPKGDWITVRTEKSFGLVSPDGKTWRALNKEPYQRTAWSPDGLKLYGLRRVEDIEILSSIDLQTGADTVLRKLPTDWYFQEPVDVGQTFSLNPDGKSFMVTAKHTRSDIWMLEGFHK